MNIKENVDLSAHSTMRLGGKARYLAEATSEQDVAQLAGWAHEHNLPIITVGSGSNIVWRDEGFGGLVIVNKIGGREVLSQNEDSAIVRIGAGENWDEIVGWAVENGFSGIETLSLIPGTAGATPVQNVEAYGQQIADTLIEVEAFDTTTQAFGGIVKEACILGYRTSRFKNVDHGRFIICGVVLKLGRGSMQPPFHRGLQKYVDEHGITDFSPASLRRAVIDIRSNKLPDPAKVPNNGSFFKNPIIEKNQFEQLQKLAPDILSYPTSSGHVKLSAMWLIEHAGFQPGYEDPQTGMALWPKHALVLVNQKAHSTADLISFRQKIIDRVHEQFGVTLEQEPELLP